MNLTSLLLEFLMNLLRDPEAAAEFKADPEGTLASAGLGDVSSDDCDAVFPVILDYAPVIGDREYNTGGNTAHGGDANSGGHDHDDHHHHHHSGGGHSGGGHSGGGNNAGGDHAYAVQKIHHIVNTYSVTEIDDRDTITDLSTNQNIWANGDVTQFFDNDAIVASGDQAVAAGDDAYADYSTDNSTNVDVDVAVGDDLNIGDNNDENNVTAGGDVAIESKNSANDDSFNDDHSTDNSVNTVVVGDENNVAAGENNTAGDVDIDVTKINAEDSAVNTGEDGEAEYENTEIETGDDSAVTTGDGDATSTETNTEVVTVTETETDFNTILAEQSQVVVEDGPGDAEAEAEAELEIDDSLVIVAPPVVETLP